MHQPVPEIQKVVVKATFSAGPAPELLMAVTEHLHPAGTRLRRVVSAGMGGGGRQQGGGNRAGDRAVATEQVQPEVPTGAHTAAQGGPEDPWCPCPLGANV